MDDALSAAAASLLGAEPVWRRVVSAGDILPLPARTLLHAGPPLLDATRPPPLLRNSAVLTCLYEGWACDMQQAETLIDSGGIGLRSATAYGVVMPLAAVAGPSTTLVEVHDPASGTTAWSELHPGGMALLRFGTRDSQVLPALVSREATLAPALAEALATPVPLLPLARAGLAGGDDLHGRTTSATAALAAELRARGTASAAVDLISATPTFFLTLWMAACRAMALAGADAAAAPGLVTALGSNGEHFGCRRAGTADTWHMAAAERPDAPPGTSAPATAPAIGDSCIIDAMGFGGQVLDRCPEIADQFAGATPGDFAERRATGIVRAVGWGRPAPCLGLDAEAVARSGVAPVIVIARLGEAGGLLGRGLYRPPASLFSTAS